MIIYDWAKVHWNDSVYQLKQLDGLDEDGEFYALISAVRQARNAWVDEKLIYIGQAYRQHVRTRIKQDHASYSKLIQYQAIHKERELLIMIGWLPKDEYSVQRVTPQFVDDVEALLIFKNKPRFNNKHKASYAGRHLLVANEGEFSPLKEWSACCSDHLTDWRRDPE
jgi:hypothetical protein